MRIDNENLPLPDLSSSEITAPIYSVVSFFAGCGGLDLGFQGNFEYRSTKYAKLPFKVIKAYDFDESCQSTYENNIGTHFEVKDLTNADVSKMPSCDVLIGGFPCQEFSICGPKGGSTSKRGALYRAMSRYARVHKPAMVVAENVAHLPRLNSGDDLLRIYRSFKLAGYRGELWKVFAPDYGVPQARDRIILVFIRKDIIGSPVPPIKKFLNSHPTVEWAIDDLISVTDESIANQSQYFRAGLAKSGNGQGDEVSPRNAPGYTVRANAKSRVQFHYSLPRRLTIRECARLQTFPDSFIFPHAATTNIRQIGNAVPPVLGHAVAESIRNFLIQKDVDLLKVGRKVGV